MILADLFDEDETYGIHRPKGHPDWKWLLCYTLDGEGLVASEHKGEQTCRAGDMLLLRSDRPHRYRTLQGKRWRFVWAHFVDVPQVMYFADEELLISRIETGHRRKRMYRTFRTILHYTRERSPLWEELGTCLLGELLLLLAEQVNRPMDPRVEQVRHYLSMRMKEQVRIDDIAASVGLSASRLSHLYKEATGQSVLQTLTEMRLRQAALLLEHSGRTAGEIAYEVGFRDYNHFAALFRKLYGASPRAYVRGRLGQG